MQICSGGIHDKIINNNVNINGGTSSQITINTTPGGPKYNFIIHNTHTVVIQHQVVLSLYAFTSMLEYSKQ